MSWPSFDGLFPHCDDGLGRGLAHGPSVDSLFGARRASDGCAGTWIWIARELPSCRARLLIRMPGIDVWPVAAAPHRGRSAELVRLRLQMLTAAPVARQEYRPNRVYVNIFHFSGLYF